MKASFHFLNVFTVVLALAAASNASAADKSLPRSSPESQGVSSVRWVTATCTFKTNRSYQLTASGLRS